MASKKRPVDLNTEILVSIRNEIASMNANLSARIDATNDRLDELRESLSARIGAVERRLTETEMRIATELVAVAGAVLEVRDLIRDHRNQAIEDLQERVTVLETKVAAS